MLRFTSKLLYSVERVNQSRVCYRATSVRFFSDNAQNQQSSDQNQQKQEQQTEPPRSNDTEIIQKLQNEVKQLKDQVLRAYAESENTRRIAARDVENARAYANTSFAKAMLDIADDLERALGTVTMEKRKEADATLKTLIDGIELSDKNMQKILAKFGVVRYGAVDDKFDPNFHEALYRIPTDEKPDTVGSVVKTGYKIKDRVLRPAQVGARVKPDN
jgi:molecular chaperone GrpE